jgi:acetyltransferase-like isoleucine patch superfamily enzyme
LLTTAALEPVIRLLGWLFAAVGRDPEGVELAERGRLLGGRRRWRIGRGVRFVGPLKRFRLADKVTLYGNAYLNAGGPLGHLEIGQSTHIDHYCVLYGQGGLSIGSECAIASGVLVYSQTNQDLSGDGTPVVRQPVRYAEVVIEDGCWLGAGVRILPGVRLGAGTHVGAGAVVRASFPGKSVIAGVPARLVAAHEA